MIRKYNASSDYKMLAGWWMKRTMLPPKAEFLPENGYIVSEKMALFICKTDSKFAILEFFISDPDTSKEQRKVLTDLLVEYVLDECKNLGYSSVYNFLEHKGSCASLERAGFKLNSNTVKFYSKELV